MEEQSPTPQRPNDVRPDAAPVPIPPVVIGTPPVGGDQPRRSPDGGDEPGRSPDEAKADAPPAPLTPMGWLQQNSPFLLAFVAVVALLYYYWGFDGIVRAGLVVVGLGLVIFIHELGHFLAAKWCNVHVQTFSLGFGPALPGCSVKWGETTYKVGILPLGGYVQMVGEGADADEDASYPRSYKNKSVLQRMFIISAGVIMNVLLGFVCFAVVYQFHGVEMPPAAVAATEAGSPAWRNGVPSGAVFTRIGSTNDPNFEDLHASVALSWWEAPISVEYKTLDGQTVQTTITPRRDANDTQPVIGVSPPSKLVLPPKRYIEDYDRPARRGSPADVARVIDLGPGDIVTAASDPDQHEGVTDLARDPAKKTFDAAELCRRMSRMGGREMVLRVRRAGSAGEAEMRVPFKGFEPDDIITGTTDPEHADDPFNVKQLKEKPGGEPGKEYDYYDFQERMKLLAGRPVVVRVLRESHGASDVTSRMASVLVPPAFHWTLGLKMKMGEVAAVRAPAADQVKERDRILAAKVMEGDRLLGEVSEGALDPVRLPFALEKAVDDAKDRNKVRVELTVNRWGEDHEQKPVTVSVPWDDRWRFDQELAFNPASPMAIPELGIAYRVESTVVELGRESPAALAVVEGTSDKAPTKISLQPNDRIQEICFKTSEKDAPGKWGYWHKTAAKRTQGGATQDEYDEWAHFFASLQVNDTPDVKVKVWRNGAELPDEIQMTAVEDPTWPIAERGIMLMPDTKLDKADNPVEAVSKGVGRTWAFIRTMYEGLVGIVAGRIDAASNVEGPIRMAKDTFQAAQDPFLLILFLGMISINLAVVNFLPIPVLDGGHMAFLIYELVRRKPPSDAVRAVASYVGLAFVATLMLFVVYLDVSHWIWGGGH